MSARVVIVSGSVGAGHDGVAFELAARLRQRGHDVTVCDMLDGFPWWVRLLLGSAYVLTLRILPRVYSLTFWLVAHSRMFQWAARRVCCTASEWLQEQTLGADVVVATYPPASQGLGDLRVRRLLDAPLVTYLTDPAPNYLWIHPGNTVHLTVTEQTALEVRQSYDVTVEAAGPLVPPAFRNVNRGRARAQLRQELNLLPDAAVGLILLGSLGVGDVGDAVAALVLADVVPIVLCGNNRRLRRRVQRMPGSVALGWRDDMATLVGAADLVVHNAGGLSLTESMVAGVPAISFAAIAGHGRANAATLERAGLAPWAQTSADLTRLAIDVKDQSCRAWPVEWEQAAERISALADRVQDQGPVTDHIREF